MLRPRSERASIALVVMVIFVMAGLATVMVAHVVSDSRVVLGDTDRAAALDASDVALAVTRARIAAGETDRFEVSGEDGPVRWAATATPASAGEWDVEMTGISHRVNKVVQARLVADDSKVWRVRDWHEVTTRVEPGPG